MHLRIRSQGNTPKEGRTQYCNRKCWFWSAHRHPDVNTNPVSHTHAHTHVCTPYRDSWAQAGTSWIWDIVSFTLILHQKVSPPCCAVLLPNLRDIQKKDHTHAQLFGWWGVSQISHDLTKTLKHGNRHECFLDKNLFIAAYHNRQKGHPVHLGLIDIISCHVQDGWAQIYISYK